MVTVPVKVTFNFDEEDPIERKKKKTSSDESSTSDDDSPDDDRMPDLEGAERKRTPGFSDEPQMSMQSSQLQEGLSKQKQSRSEKKVRKALTKLGLKLVPGIKRVAIKKSKTVLFIIAQPEVYKSSSSDTYVVLGEVKVEDSSQQAQVAAAEKFRPGANNGQLMTRGGGGGSREEGGAAADAFEEIDETGISPEDIDLVMSQTGVSRAKAVTALRNNGYDIVNAIMNLTM